MPKRITVKSTLPYRISKEGNILKIYILKVNKLYYCGIFCLFVSSDTATEFEGSNAIAHMQFYIFNALGTQPLHVHECLQ